MLTPIEAMSAEAVTAEGAVPEVAMAIEGVSLKVTSADVPTEVPKFPRMPKPRPMPT